MKVAATPRFLREAKRLHELAKAALDDAVRTIASTPETGELKKGDLAGVRVFKYRFQNQQVLVAYRVAEEQNSITLLSFGGHENFYRDLKGR